jgi:hypothetical protein
MLPDLGLRQWLGVVVFAVSTLTWLATPAIFFLDIPGADKVAWASMSYGISLVTWYMCLPLLGPEFLALGRKWLAWLKNALREPVDQ